MENILKEIKERDIVYMSKHKNHYSPEKNSLIENDRGKILEENC